jgi:DNA polymerase-4
MTEALAPIIDKVWHHCETRGTRGRTVTLKVKYADFEQITRSRTLSSVVAARSDLESVSVELLQALMPVPKGVRLLGISLSTLLDDETLDTSQLTFTL